MSKQRLFNSDKLDTTRHLINISPRYLMYTQFSAPSNTHNIIRNEERHHTRTQRHGLQRSSYLIFYSKGIHYALEESENNFFEYNFKGGDTNIRIDLKEFFTNLNQKREVVKNAVLFAK